MDVANSVQGMASTCVRSLSAAALLRDPRRSRLRSPGKVDRLLMTCRYMMGSLIGWPSSSRRGKLRPERLYLKSFGLSGWMLDRCKAMMPPCLSSLKVYSFANYMLASGSCGLHTEELRSGLTYRIDHQGD